MPVNQTIQFDATSLRQVGSGAVTAFLYLDATLVATLGSIAENATLDGRYTGTVADKTAATYRLVVRFNGYDDSDPEYQVTLLLVDGTYVAKRYAELNSVTLSAIADIATGWTSQQRADVLSALGIGDPGTIEPVVITPADPGETTGFFVCRNSDNSAKSGVVVSVILDRLRSATTGNVYFATAREFTSAGNGLVEITHLLPGCAYYMTISGVQSWFAVPASAGSSFALPDLKIQ